MAYYLEALADVAVRQDLTQRAAALLAAATALLEAKGSGWLHAYVPRAPHGEESLAGLHAGLNDVAFDHAQAYGRSLTGTSAVTYALGKPDRQPELPALRRPLSCPAGSR